MARKRMSIQDQLCAGLIALGFTEIRKTTHYRRFAKFGTEPPNPANWFVGASGALRSSPTGVVSDTRKCKDVFRQTVLRAGADAASQN
jgi:hypothetical protein